MPGSCDVCREVFWSSGGIFLGVVRPGCLVRPPVLLPAGTKHSFETCVGWAGTSSSHTSICTSWSRRTVLFCALPLGRGTCGACGTCRPHILCQRGPSGIASRYRMSYIYTSACNRKGGFLVVQKLGKPLSPWCESKALVCWVKGMSCVSLVLAALFELGLCSLGLS